MKVAEEVAGTDMDVDWEPVTNEAATGYLESASSILTGFP